MVLPLIVFTTRATELFSCPLVSVVRLGIAMGLALVVVDADRQHPDMDGELEVALLVRTAHDAVDGGATIRRIANVDRPEIVFTPRTGHHNCHGIQGLPHGDFVEHFLYPSQPVALVSDHPRVSKISMRSRNLNITP